MRPYTMKSILRCLAFSLVTLALVPAAHAQLGLSAGPNFDRLSDISLSDGDAAFDNRTGWHVEAWFSLDLGAVAVRPGIRYHDAGGLYDGLTDDDDPDFTPDVTVNLIEVPLNLRYRFSPVPAPVKPYVAGGPILRFPLADDDSLNDDLETLGVAAEVGVGLEVQAGVFRLFPEVLYSFDISGFVKDDFSIGDRDFTTDDTQYLNAVMVRLGIGL